MKKIVLASMASLWFASFTAAAGQSTAPDDVTRLRYLVKMCEITVDHRTSTPTGAFAKGYCLGYLRGWMDLHDAGSAICIPAGIPFDDLVQALIKYGKGH